MLERDRALRHSCLARLSRYQIKAGTLPAPEFCATNLHVDNAPSPVTYRHVPSRLTVL